MPGGPAAAGTGKGTAPPAFTPVTTLLNERSKACVATRGDVPVSPGIRGPGRCSCAGGGISSRSLLAAREFGSRPASKSPASGDCCGCCHALETVDSRAPWPSRTHIVPTPGFQSNSQPRPSATRRKVTPPGPGRSSETSNTSPGCIQYLVIAASMSGIARMPTLASFCGWHRQSWRPPSRGSPACVWPWSDLGSGGLST
mmetsp:Transcript_53999/g.140665  ORF Transcript_53999/g.140665 Transcript_53999/m.140665 type:complete len:200 (+) Transcript_53999:274-873(+)